MRVIFGYTLKLPLEKNCPDATKATMHVLKQVVWGDIWKPLKYHTNNTNVTWNLPSRNIWGVTLDKNKTNATNVTFHLFRGVIWEDIWKATLGRTQKCNHCKFSIVREKSLMGHLKNRSVAKYINLIDLTLHENVKRIQRNFFWIYDHWSSLSLFVTEECH